MPSAAVTPLPARGFGPPRIEGRDLVFEAGGRRLIDRVDVAIRQERRLVVMGANGAGKSLLLRMLHGLVAPASGEVLWEGASLDHAARRAQAMVFQRPVMLRRSVRANLRFALSVRGLNGRGRAAREGEALALARLEHLAPRPARVLSGGEQQRLAVARALACRPRALFLDEPTASLDPCSTEAIEDLIRMAHADGVAIVLVTHDVGQARRLGDDLLFLHRGGVAEAGPVDRVLDAPRSEAAGAWLDGRLYLDPAEGRSAGTL